VPVNRRVPDTEEVSSREKGIEIVSAVLLALAALAAAWSGYQASLWDGIQSSDYTQASGLRTRSSENHLDANQQRLADLSLFENYLDAHLRGETELADFYRARFRPEFTPAFEAWLALDPINDSSVPHSPLVLPEYTLASEQEATRQKHEADATFEHGEDANGISDTYVFTTIFFASVLFLAAIAERLEFFPLRVSLLAFAAVAFVTGVVIIVMQPVTSG
jgi:hypothetical protein